MTPRNRLEGVSWGVNASGEFGPRHTSGKPVAWAPFPGAQQLFLSCPLQEVLYTGTRGGGKTQGLIADFCADVGKGFGRQWRGILFRRESTQLEDVRNKCHMFIPRFIPGARYLGGNKDKWVFPDGEELLLRHIKRIEDYSKYHGHEYPWIGFEELTEWPVSDMYLRMFSCNRTTHPGIVRRIRATCNPGGPGHQWVKARFRLAGIPQSTIGPIVDDDVIWVEELDSLDTRAIAAPPRVAIHSHMSENLALMHANPHYMDEILAQATSPEQRRAWGYGDWDIVAGGMFSDLWRAPVHVLPAFPVELIPSSWRRIDRSFDWGSAKPWSVGIWAQSNGEPIVHKGRTIGEVPGDLIRIDEIYGCEKGRPNVGRKVSSAAMAREILARQKELASRGLSKRVLPGPADSSIWNETDPNDSVAKRMEAAGVRWEKADKSKGSRVNGWQLMRDMLEAAVPPTGRDDNGEPVKLPREEPGLFVTERCVDFIRTVPSLPRDVRNPDDVDTDAEDHIADETRYRVRFKPQTFSVHDDAGIW